MLKQRLFRIALVILALFIAGAAIALKTRSATPAPAANPAAAAPALEFLASDLIQVTPRELRPILMTTLAMVFGMVPLAFGLAEGSEQRAPMGQAVIGGIITSSLLTLVVVPVTYTYLDDLALWFKRKLAPSPSPPADSDAATPL